MMGKIYPDSGVELNKFIAGNYDTIMNVGSLGLYRGFIKKTIRHMDIQPGDHILDLGCGTGRNAKLMCAYLNEQGHITGLDISERMESQFRRNFETNGCAEFINQRIDIPFDLGRLFDKIFISFVIHGFPHEVRSVVIKNAYRHLKPGGTFFILDFAEFDMDAMPTLYRFVFKTIECKYAFDFIKRDWKKILQTYGFGPFAEHFYLRKYVRLLAAQKSA